MLFTQLGMLLAAYSKNFSLDDLIGMDPLDRNFLYFWYRQHEMDKAEQLGRMLGVMFNVGEVRGWDESEGPSLGLMDHETLLIPLSFMLNGEARGNLKKMVGTESQMASKERKEGQVLVDLGKVSPEDFKAFIEKNRVERLKG
jgi:hypothetical protein